METNLSAVSRPCPANSSHCQSSAILRVPMMEVLCRKPNSQRKSWRGYKSTPTKRYLFQYFIPLQYHIIWWNTGTLHHIFPHNFVSKVRTRCGQQAHTRHFVQTQTQPRQIQRQKQQLGSSQIDILQSTKLLLNSKNTRQRTQNSGTRDTNRKNIQLVAGHVHHERILKNQPTSNQMRNNIIQNHGQFSPAPLLTIMICLPGLAAMAMALFFFLAVSAFCCATLRVGAVAPWRVCCCKALKLTGCSHCNKVVWPSLPSLTFKSIEKRGLSGAALSVSNRKGKRTAKKYISNSLLTFVALLGSFRR